MPAPGELDPMELSMETPHRKPHRTPTEVRGRDMATTHEDRLRELAYSHLSFLKSARLYLS